MNQKLTDIQNQYTQKIASVKTADDLENLRIELFGRKGLLNELFQDIKNVPSQDRKTFGQELNQLKKVLEDQLNDKASTVTEVHDHSSDAGVRPLYEPPKIGHLH
ncbi:MAG TPA: hypothetical protein VF828_05190, partial [Patescibacteria group bacterium]